MGIQLLDAPSNRRDDPRAHRYIVDHVKPGQTIQRRIQVSNNSSAVLPVTVYSAAATIDNGVFTPAGGNTSNELTGWVTAGNTAFDLPAGTKRPVEITIAVPANASSGERYATIWAQTAQPASTGAAGARVLMATRVGVRVYLNVGPGGDAPSAFEIDSLTASREADGTPVVSAQVRNTGGRALDLSGSLALADGPGGTSAGPFPATAGMTVAPDQAGSVPAKLDKRLPAGPWTVRFTVTSGVVKQEATATLVFPGAGTTGPATAPNRPEQAWWSAWWVWVAVGLGLMLLVLGHVLRRGQPTGRGTRRARRGAQPATRQPPASQGSPASPVGGTPVGGIPPRGAGLERTPARDARGERTPARGAPPARHRRRSRRGKIAVSA